MIRAKHHRFDSGMGYVYSWLSMGLILSVLALILINILYLGIDVISFDFFIKEPSASAMDLKRLRNTYAVDRYDIVDLDWNSIGASPIDCYCYISSILFKKRTLQIVNKISH